MSIYQQVVFRGNRYILLSGFGERCWCCPCYIQKRMYTPDHRLLYGNRWNNLNDKFLSLPVSYKDKLNSQNTFCTSMVNRKEKSKVQETVKALKHEKLKSDLIRLGKKQLVTDKEESKSPETPVYVVSKKTLHQRIIHEIKHYYNGFKLLFIDIRFSLRYCWKMLKGTSLSRRERRQLVRTTSDLFRLVPFTVFVIVPFMEFLLPVALKVFPNMLPSTFAEDNKEQEKMRRKLKVKLEMAKFLQDTLEETAITRKGAKGEKVQEFTNFMEKIRLTGESVSNEEILNYSKLFEDEITLDNLTYRQLRALCKLLDISVVDVSATVLRFQLELKMRELETDDRMIQKEGINSLEVWELQEACRARGMRSLGMPKERLEAQLQQWLDLHLKSKIPTSLLLLSRTLYLPENVPTVTQLKAIITELPETATEEAKVKISEVLGDRVDNKAKLETIKQEEQIIMAEKEDYAKETFAKEEEHKRRIAAEKEKIKEIADSEKREIFEDITKQVTDAIQSPSVVDSPFQGNSGKEEIVTTNAEILKGKAEDFEKEPNISPEDLSDIEDILETVVEERTTMRIEKEDLQELKQDVSEYIESVEELKSVLMTDGGNQVQLEESKSAQHLRKMVNTMIVQMDSVVNNLIQEKTELLENIETKEIKVKQNVALQEDPALRQKVLQQITKHKEDLIGVNDILLAVKNIQKIPDDTKCQKMAQVAKILDTDCDGIIDIAHTLKVIEVIGRENVNLTTRQVSKIIELLQKEQLLHEDKKDQKIKEKHKQILNKGIKLQK